MTEKYKDKETDKFEGHNKTHISLCKIFIKHIIIEKKTKTDILIHLTAII
jgi:hypothetical protein